MITFLKLGKYGRFGNQLFQYAALRSLGLKNNCEIGLPYLDNVSHHNQNNLLNNLSIPDKFFGKTKFYHYFTQKKFVLNDSIAISEKFYDLKDGTDIQGYFQSIYYFKDCVDIIKKELTPKEKYISEANDKINKIKDKYPNYEIVSLHLRRGDITDVRELMHSTDYYGGKELDYKSLNGEYLLNSKLVFKNKKVKFLVFSGGATSNKNDKDLDWCRHNLTGEEYIISDPQDTIQDFSLITACDHNIISRTSTFGWWAAFLNDKKNSIVIVPKIYDPEKPEHTRYMFYLDKWLMV